MGTVSSGVGDGAGALDGVIFGAGVGVFAKTGVPAGTTVTEYVGGLAPTPEARTDELELQQAFYGDEWRVCGCVEAIDASTRGEPRLSVEFGTLRPTASGTRSG